MADFNWSEDALSMSDVLLVTRRARSWQPTRTPGGLGICRGEDITDWSCTPLQ